MKRREFMRAAAVGGAGVLILPSGALGQNAPSNKLNVALIGVWGRGTAHYNILANENVVALCDVNENRLAEGVRIFPKAKTYWDWRRCLDQKDIDAVVICTADHHHAFIANWALNRGKHVYCEKPIGISVEEVRTVRANYLKQRAKIATQHGTQRHAYPNFERIRELILDGAIGELKSASCWDSRENGRPGYPPGEGEPPSFFHYDQWIGPSPHHPYSPQYFARPAAGNNCLAWNPFRDFGVGQIGDMGAHTMDIVYNAIDAGAPTGIEVDTEVSDKYDPNVCPVKLKVAFEHPKNNWRGPVTVVWYQGGLKPITPIDYVDVGRIANGAIFEGSKGFLVADFTSRLIIPSNNDGDMTYYRRRSKDEVLPLIMGTGQRANPPVPRRAPAAGRPAAAARPAAPAPAMSPTAPGFPLVELGPGGVPPNMLTPNNMIGRVDPNSKNDRVFQDEWIAACKGQNSKAVHGTSTKTHCDFEYSGTLVEEMLLGLVAHRAGKKIEYDPATGRVTNAPEVNDYLKRQYRPGWTLNG